MTQNATQETKKIFETQNSKNAEKKKRRERKGSGVTVPVQEIAGPLEASVALPSLTTVTQEQQSSNRLQLQLQPSLSLWHALQRYSIARPCCIGLSLSSLCCCRVSFLLSSRLFMAWCSYPVCSFLGSSCQVVLNPLHTIPELLPQEAHVMSGKGRRYFFSSCYTSTQIQEI